MEGLSDAEKAIISQHPPNQYAWPNIYRLQEQFPNLRAAFSDADPKAAVERLVETEEGRMIICFVVGALHGFIPTVKQLQSRRRRATLLDDIEDVVKSSSESKQVKVQNFFVGRSFWRPDVPIPSSAVAILLAGREQQMPANFWQTVYSLVQERNPPITTAGRPGGQAGLQFQNILNSAIKQGSRGKYAPVPKAVDDQKRQAVVDETQAAIKTLRERLSSPAAAAEFRQQQKNKSKQQAEQREQQLLRSKAAASAAHTAKIDAAAATAKEQQEQWEQRQQQVKKMVQQRQQGFQNLVGAMASRRNNAAAASVAAQQQKAIDDSSKNLAAMFRGFGLPGSSKTVQQQPIRDIPLPKNLQKQHTSIEDSSKSFATILEELAAGTDSRKAHPQPQPVHGSVQFIASALKASDPSKQALKQPPLQISPGPARRENESDWAELPTSNKHLCLECRECFRNAKPVALGGHHKTFAELENAAARGCPICNMVLHDLSDEAKDNLRDHISLSQLSLIDSRDPSVFLYRVLISYRARKTDTVQPKYAFVNPRVTNPTIYTPTYDVQLFIRQREDAPIPMAPSTGSTASYDVVRNWIIKCRESHKLCGTLPSRSRARPARLIYVGSKDDFSDVQLHTGTQIDEKSLYTTLSHRWGDPSKIIKLVDSNLAAFQTQLPFHDLPQTFQDAIAFVRRLGGDFGVKYIWIDSLCIVQDSKEDWVDQAAIMGLIYHHSFLTIAANSSSGQLFAEREPLKIAPCELTLMHGKMEGQMVRCEKLDSWTKDIQKSLLLSRAWVLQERLLSPRVVHFTDTQMYWECFSCEANENHPKGIPTGCSHTSKNWSWENFEVVREANMFDFEARTYTRAREGQERRIIPTRQLPKIEPSADPLLSVWRHIVTLFTACHLTYKSDKLPAISAIARKIAEYSEDEYLAGMWRKDLLRQLPWATIGRQHSRPTPYRAPTWSWASIDGEAELVLLGGPDPATRPDLSEEQGINAPLQGLDANPDILFSGGSNPTMLAELLEAYVSSPINDPFLEVDGGSITLAGYLLKGTVELFPNEINTGKKMPRSCLVFAGHYASLTYYYSDYAREGLELPHEAVYCLPIYHVPSPGKNQVNPQIVGLGLQRTGNGVYERCGIWMTITPPACDWALAVAKATELQEEEYLERFREGKYKIEIV